MGHAPTDTNPLHNHTTQRTAQLVESALNHYSQVFADSATFHNPTVNIYFPRRRRGASAFESWTRVEALLLCRIESHSKRRSKMEVRP